MLGVLVLSFATNLSMSSVISYISLGSFFFWLPEFLCCSETFAHAHPQRDTSLQVFGTHTILVPKSQTLEETSVLHVI